MEHQCTAPMVTLLVVRLMLNAFNNAGWTLCLVLVSLSPNSVKESSFYDVCDVYESSHVLLRLSKGTNK
jgi:hypothetical protein